MIKVDNKNLVELKDIYFVSVDNRSRSSVFFGVPEFVCARILRSKGELTSNTVIAPFYTTLQKAFEPWIG